LAEQAIALVVNTCASILPSGYILNGMVNSFYNGIKLDYRFP